MYQGKEIFDLQLPIYDSAVYTIDADFQRFSFTLSGFHFLRLAPLAVCLLVYSLCASISFSVEISRFGVLRFDFLCLQLTSCSTNSLVQTIVNRQSKIVNPFFRFPQWACVDSNHGPLRYQHSALTV
jgi:hypothetical protein